MKRSLVLLAFMSLFSATKLCAQNRPSYPADATLSAPELNFEVFWKTFEDIYAFFKLRNIAWNKMYSIYRPAVNPATSDDSMFTIFSRMLEPFHDNHINLFGTGGRRFKSAKSSQFATEFPTDSLRKAFRSMVDHTLEEKGFGELIPVGPEFREEPLFWYATSKESGYLRFNRCFADPDADGTPDAAVAGLALDTIFSQLKNKKALIVDVRDNIGGNDEFSFEVASRFARERQLGMYKRTRKPGGGYDDLMPLEYWYVAPKADVVKPVVVLSNDKTVSAADVFAMVMNELPGVTLAGSNSRGIYSDMYGFTLPNEWEVTLSNQRYYNPAGICYEGKGTLVDVRVLNKRKYLNKMKDPVVLKALKILK